MHPVTVTVSVIVLLAVPAAALVRSFGPRRLPRLPQPENPLCPIMGKPVAKDLFVDTRLGRIHVCCPGCRLDVLDDVQGAWLVAFGPKGGKAGGAGSVPDAGGPTA